MILDSVEKYYQTLDADFHFLYAELLKEESEGNVHALRLNLKKQLAFFNLMTFLVDNFPLKSICKPYRECMKKTSKLRDLKVEQKIICQDEKKHKLSKRLSKHLQAEENYQKTLLRGFEEEHSILPLREASETTLAYLNQLRGNTGIWVRLSNYYLSQLDHIRRAVELCEIKKDENGLHDLRTLVKELMLNLALPEQLAPGKKRLKKIRTMLDDLQDLLGEWHDRNNALLKAENGKKYTSKKLIKILEKEKQQYFTQTLEILGNFGHLYREILDILHDFFSHPPVTREPGPPKTYPRKIRKVKRRPSFPQKNLGEVTR